MIKSSKERLLQNNADVFQLKTDFVARPEGIIHGLVHIPVVDISSKLKLFQHILTPITAGKYQMAGDDQVLLSDFAKPPVGGLAKSVSCFTLSV